jgi:hypothetical protein
MGMPAPRLRALEGRFDHDDPDVPVGYKGAEGDSTDDDRLLGD